MQNSQCVHKKLRTVIRSIHINHAKYQKYLQSHTQLPQLKHLYALAHSTVVSTGLDLSDQW